MNVSRENVVKRLEQFKRRHWRQSEVSDWYGVDFTDLATKKIIAQAMLFAGTSEHPSSYGSLEQCDHWHLEIFLQRRDLIPIKLAAAELALSVKDFRQVIEAMETRDDFLTFPRAFAAKSFVFRNFLRDLHLGFPSLRRMIFASQPSFIKRLHNEIRSVLHLEVQTEWCETSKILGGSLPGHEIDCLTDEPIGIGNSVWLDFKKPVQLTPDVCSWKTYARFQSELKPFVSLVPDDLTGEVMSQLKHHEN
jgi:hypothetical protein